MSDFPEYHKINGLYKRDDRGNMLFGEFARPEFEYLYYNDWLLTEKVDGTNIRIGMIDGVPRIGGRTENSQIPTFLYGRIQQLLDQIGLSSGWTETFGTDIYEGCNVVLYGEGYGARIQKGGGNYLPDTCDFVLFDVLVGEWWLQRADVEDVGYQLGLACVPIVGVSTLEDAEALVQDGITSEWGDFEAEGVVCTPAVPLAARDGKRVITKIKRKDYEQPVSTQRPRALPIVPGGRELVAA